MAIQQLTQPIINPISAFDSTKAHTISFVVIGGAQVIGNRLVISDNQTGREIYNKIQSTMKLEHSIPANTLTNGGYYNAVVYTIDSANNESAASTPVPFYCYSQPSLTIDNIPATETIENGTYRFIGSYLQKENELLNSYQYTLYDSNRDVLSQSALIYYNADSSLSYTFVGMSNDTAYYIELSGETINGTKITSGLKYFTVRYIQPASFAICDLVNNCEDGYIQISSNIVAIDGKSNPDPPIYIDDKEVDLRDPDSWVEWNSGFRIQDDFTMRVWGRDFNDYQNIITLTNDINTTTTPNKIELKWMVGDVIKTLPSYTTVEGKNINILNAEAAKIENLSIGGSSEQRTEDEIDFGTAKFLTVNTEKTLPLQVNVLGNQEQITQVGSYKEAQGESIHVTDVDNSKPGDIIVKGNEYQEVRSGKNYLDTFAKYKAGDTVTIEGITYTFNNDGSITCNGTASATANSNLDFSAGVQTINGTNKKIVGLLTGSQVPAKMGLTAYTATWGANPVLTFSEVNQSLQTNLRDNENYTIFRIVVYSGTTVNNQTVYYQILDTSETDLTYEQYGIAPSPDYPSEVQTVGSNINLIPTSLDAWEQGTLSSGNPVNNTKRIRNKDYCAMEVAKQTISLTNSQDYKVVNIHYYDTNKSYITNENDLHGNANFTQLTFTPPDKTAYFKTVLSKKNDGDIIVSDILKIQPKLELGSVITPYSPYNMGSVEIVKNNKNLYNGKTEIGGINNDGTLNNTTDRWRTTDYINVENITDISMNVYNITATGALGRYCFYDKNYNFLSSTQIININTIINVSNVSYFKFWFLNDKVPSNAQIQVELGSTSTAYIQSQEQFYILPIQQEMLTDDYINWDSEKEIHTWGKKVFNGTENIRLTTNGNSFALDMTDMLSNTQQDKVPPLISNYYKASSWIQRNEYKEKYSVSQFGQVLGFDKGDLTSVGDFKTWLKAQYDAGTPVIVYYKLATPVQLSLTSDQLSLKSQLYNTTLYEGITNIANESSYPAILDLKYNIIRDMPSPNYPSEIKTVGGNVNLLENTLKSQVINGINISVDNNGEITLNGTATDSFGLVIGTINKISNMIFSGMCDGYGYNKMIAQVQGLNYNVNIVNSNPVVLPEFNSNANARIYIYKGTNITNAIIKPKIEKGTIATSYSPHNQGSTKLIVHNKNFINIDTVENLYLNPNTGATSISNAWKTSDFIRVNLGTYNFSWESTSNYFQVNVCFYDINKSFISGTQFVLYTYGNSFNIPGGCIYIRISYSINVSGQPVERNNIMLEEGSSRTQYQAYQEKSYILPIQQEMLEGDVFTQELNKKEIHHWARITLTGDENWVYDSTYNYFRCPTYTFEKVPSTASGDGVKQLSNYFSVVGDWNTFRNNTNLNGFNPVSNIGYRLVIRNTNCTNIDEFKAWLKSKNDEGMPVMIYYKTETSYVLNCTSEQSNILDELNELESYYPQTNIYTGENIALINAKYLGLPNPYKPSKIYALGDIKNLINIPAFNIKYNQQYFQSTNTNFILKPDFIYTLSFDYNVNETSTDLYYSIGYGTNGYDVDLKSNIQYQSLTKGRNSVSFIVPENIPDNASLWVRFAQTIILADINVDISNVQLESGNISTDYEDPNLYNIYPTSASKNLFNYDSPVYLLKNNATYTPIQNGYNIKPTVTNQDAYIGIGIKNVLNSGDTYTVSFSQLGQFEKFSLYMTEKGNENIISEIPINNNTFVAPEGVYDLQLVFEVDSSSLSNYIEIWNIQIEANNVISEYEPYVSNSSVISLDEPLRGLGEYRDLICLESPNILNPETQSGIVKGDTVYYLNQTGNTQYYIWYYNEDGNLIKFLDTEGHEASGIVSTKGSFTTHKDCVKITITKSSNPDSQDVTSDELKTNHVGVTKGNTAQVYYPYVTEPSVIRYIDTKILDGTENWIKYGSFRGGFLYYVDNIINAYTDSNNFYGIGISTHFIWDIKGDNIFPSARCQFQNGKRLYIGFREDLSLKDFTEYLKLQYNANTPIYINYVLSTPTIIPLSENNINALKAISTYKPISNVFANNEVFGYLKLDYVSDYTEQQTQNAYVLLKCWNANSMPYICHSNYIDIPDEKDKVFIWMRRKNNLFDLKIENLGDYNEDDKPTDKTKPIVTLEINPNNVEATRIPVTAYSIDDNGLKTVRFSKDNGNTWDEIVNVDGLSSTNSYIFINLNPNTTYTIRVEAIDLAGNIGGISQQVTTKSS